MGRHNIRRRRRRRTDPAQKITAETPSGPNTAVRAWRKIPWGYMILAAILFVVLLSAFHFLNGFDFANSIRATYHDAKMVAECPTNPDALIDFINRTPAEEHRVASRSGGVPIYEAYCKMYTVPDIMDELENLR